MLNSIHADKLLASAIARVEADLKSQLNSENIFVRRLLAHTGAGRGKRLRARLTLLSARALGVTDRRVERLAVAMELLHQATLVHDDVIDDSQQRRHRPTLNARFGNQAAVLAGDLILVKAVDLLLQRGFPAGINTIVVRSVSAVCLGEIQELNYYQNFNLTLVQYLEIISNKTASLLAAACESGAVLAEATQARTEKMARYGREFGMAFQIQDDLLDLTGQSESLGKPVGLDIKEGRVTLPVILGLRRCRGRERQRLLRELKSQGARSGIVLELLQSCGALAQTRELAGEYAQRARQSLAGLPKSAARAALMDLADFAVERNH